MDIKEHLLDIYSDGGEWEDFEPHIDDMLSRIAALEARLKEAEEVIKAGQVLVLKMFEVYEDPQYRTAFSLLADHQGAYNGEQWTQEQDNFTDKAAAWLKGGEG